MLLLFYTTYICVDLAHDEMFRAKVGKGGIHKLIVTLKVDIFKFYSIPKFKCKILSQTRPTFEKSISSLFNTGKVPYNTSLKVLLGRGVQVQRFNFSSFTDLFYRLEGVRTSTNVFVSKHIPSKQCGPPSDRQEVSLLGPMVA